jgi:hypothetical protein
LEVTLTELRIRPPLYTDTYIYIYTTITKVETNLNAQRDLSKQTNVVRFWHLSQSYPFCVKFNLGDTLTDHTTQFN